MNKRGVIGLSLLAGLLLLTPVRAHEVAVIGDYMVQFRWRDEPALVNQPNAVVLTFTKSATAATSAEAGPSSQLEDKPATAGQVIINPTAADAALVLTVLLAYAAEEQVLNLAPSPRVHDEYSAAVTPTRAGRYLLRFQGQARGQSVDLAAPLETVQASDLLHYLQTIFSTTDLRALPLAYWVILALAGFGLWVLVWGGWLLLKG